MESSRNLRVAHQIMRDANGGRCRKSGDCELCDDEMMASYREAVSRKRRMDIASWVGALIVIVALAVAFGMGWL